MYLRTILSASSIALALSACATQAPTPAPAQKPAAPTAAPAAPAPATISGVAVTCEKTTDGKNAQWMGKKH
jgi:hypothetical protein